MHVSPSRRHRRLRPTLLAVALGCAVPAGHLHAQGAAALDATTPVVFAIAAKPLGEALTDWAAQSRIPLHAEPALVAGRSAPAVSGSLPPMQALQQLLAGTELAAQGGGKGVVVRPASSSTASLPAVRVRGVVSASPLGYLARKTVTGALGEKAVLDTPFSIAVVDSREMAERGAKSIGQIFFNDASVYTPTPSSSTDWWGTQVRGLGVRNNYVDDIPMLLYWGGDFPTEVVESVTALKGLTGFMYGFGEPGGALSYKLKRPKSAAGTELTVGYRNPRLLSVHVDTNHVAGEELFLRANIAAEKGKAYNAAHIDRTAGSLAIDKHFGASLKWFSTLVYEDSKTKGEPLQWYFSRYDAAGSGGRLPRVTYDHERMNVDNSYYQTKTLLASTGVDWRINDRWKLNAQVGVSRKDHRSNKAFANLINREGDYEGVMYNFAGRLDTVFSQAVVTGSEQLAGMKHDIVGGVGLQRSRDRWADEFYWQNDFDGNLYTDQTFLVTRTPDFSLLPVDHDARQQYAFLSETVHLTDRLRALVGLRYTNYKLKDLDGDPTAPSGYKASRVSPTLALVYKPDASTSVYGSFVEALEPGTRVSPPYLNAGEVLGATVSRQAEVGVKHQSDKVEYTAALFQIQRSNQMEEGSGAARYLTQDGRTIYRGVELSVAHQATRRLNIGASTVYLDGRIDKVSEANAALQGNTPANAGRWQAVAHAQYKVPAVTGLKLHTAVRYFGPTYTSDDNLLEVPGRTVVNAGFTHDFKMQGLPWTLAGNLNNVFNRKYWASGGWGSGNLGEARNASVTLKTQF